MRRLISLEGAGVDRFCCRLLDDLAETIGAERGHVLLCHPRSTEAQVVCARRYETTNFSMHEYRVSRTVVRQVRREGRPLLLKDASKATGFADKQSLLAARVRSILAAPLEYRGSTQGVIYFEHTAPDRFASSDARLVTLLAGFVGFYLGHARLLLLDQSGRVFLDSHKAMGEIIGRDPVILEILETVRQVADRPTTVLISGESGTGKELVAQALHYESSRRNRPFVALNCAAFSASLVESELFGHEKNAFTGADRQYMGRIEQASGGTIFFDEINHLPYALQPKLLRFLESREIMRVGGKGAIKLDVRVLAATSEDLLELARSGRFHEPLFYRLHVVPIKLPPLRQRRLDIPLLVDHFVAEYSSTYCKVLNLTSEVHEWLQAQPFPGNIRQLKNLVERLFATSRAETVRLEDVPRDLRDEAWEQLSVEPGGLSPSTSVPRSIAELNAQVRAYTDGQRRRLAEHAVHMAGGSVSRAATQLGVHRATVHNWLRGERHEPVDPAVSPAEAGSDDA